MRRAASMVIALSLTSLSATAGVLIETRALTVAGKPRTYFVYQPAAEGTRTLRPLLLLLHGSQSSGREL